MLLLGQLLKAFALNLRRAKYGMKCVTNERHESTHARNLPRSGIHSLHINNSCCSWRLFMTCVRPAVKYKMDHVIVELVKNWKSEKLGDLEICFQIGKEQETLKHFFFLLQNLKKELFSEYQNWRHSCEMKYLLCSAISSV